MIGGRDAPLPGVTGKLVLDDVPRVDAARLGADARGRAALALAWARPGDVVVTLGVGEPWRIARAVVEGLPAVRSIEHGVAARAADDDRRRRARAGARAPALGRRARPRRCASPATRGSPVLVVGLGSNVLAADEGVEALVLRLEGELAAVEVARPACSCRRGRDERRLPPSRARRRGSAGSSSRARSRARPEAACA